MPFELTPSPIENSGPLFASSHWLELLRESFGCRTVYVDDPQRGENYSISVFKAGPFRVAYLEFPVGTALGSKDRYQDLSVCLQGLPSPLRPHCVRVSVSGFCEELELGLSFAETPETAIVDLPSWSVSQVSNNVRRDLKRARKAELAVRDADAKDALAVYHLYENTIKRKRGNLRYSADYFQRLVALASIRDDLKVLVSGPVGTPTGFVVTARHSGTGYYLHGGSDPAQRQHRPAALLMNAAISWAQNTHCRMFNFMSSPASQPSLVQYKEKWAGITRAHRTYTLPVSRTYPIFRAAELAHGFLSRALP